MGNVTKNYLSEEQIVEIVKRSFSGMSLAGYEALSGGFCNAVYRLTLSDGSSAILKVSPSDTVTLMSCEQAMMATEAKAMSLASNAGISGVPRVYSYDDSKAVFSGSYLLMEDIKGSQLSVAKETADESYHAAMDRKVGAALAQIHSIKGEKFGHLTLSGKQYENWYEALFSMISGVIEDGKRAKVDIGISYDDILKLLSRDKAAFDEVVVPSLVHWDSWDGNFLVEGETINGIIDWERAMWADPLMEDRFRSHSTSSAFKEGYGKPVLTEAEELRCLWYDVYLYLVMMIEGTYRQYEDDGQYRWVKGLFQPVWEKLSAG